MTKFSRDHVAVIINKKVATLCLTEELLKNVEHISSIRLPDENNEVGYGDEFAMVHTATEDIEVLSPITGTIIQVNEKLFEDLDELLDNPDKNWLCKISIDDPSEIQELLDFDDYHEFCDNEEREDY